MLRRGCGCGKTSAGCRDLRLLHPGDCTQTMGSERSGGVLCASLLILTVLALLVCGCTGAEEGMDCP